MTMTSPSNKSSKRHNVIWLVVLVVLVAGGGVAYQIMPLGMMSHNGAGGDHVHDVDGTGHDEVSMPGLHGINVTPEESAELAAMFLSFETITRDVTNLPNGIRTVTRSSDVDVMD